MLLQQFVNGLSLGAVYAVFAIGFTLIFGVMNVLNLSQGAVFMWGAYVGLEVVRTLAPAAARRDCRGGGDRRACSVY